MTYAHRKKAPRFLSTKCWIQRVQELGSGPITKMVIESALDEEMSEHLGYDKHAAEGRNGHPRIMRETGAISHAEPGDQHPSSSGHEGGNG